MTQTKARKAKHVLGDTPCIMCDQLYPAARQDLGYPTCTECGDKVAAKARTRWTVAQEYNKGNYQLITNPATLRGTNPKRTT